MVPSVERAIAMYAAEHKLCPSTVTEQIVASSEEGLEHWACLHLDMGARGATGQALVRAFKKNKAAKNIYKWLSEDLKRKLRQSWGIARDFETVLKKQVRVLKNTNLQKEIGTWKSELQLQVHFGGPDRAEAVRQASCYISMCKKFPEPLL